MKTGQREYGLDAFKGILIVFVIISHFTWSPDERSNYLFPFWIDMAVPFFMLISGYLHAASIERNNIECIETAYELKHLIRKIIRYTVPFAIVYIIEMILYYLIRETTFSKLNYLFVFWRGGAGAGSYYWPVMIQLVFIFPIIYFIIKKNPVKGLFIILVANALFEFTQRAYGVTENVYRLLVFRYLFAIGFGCFLFLYRKKINIFWYILLFVIGAIGIIAWRYCGKEPKILIYWAGTNFVCSMFVMPVFAFIVRYLKGVKVPVLGVVGKASYNIFLVQMLLYDIPQEYITQRIDSRGWHLVFNIVICIVVGVLFWVVEKSITQKIIRMMEHIWKK